MIFGSMPQGRGGMERIISTLLESNGVAKFSSFYFDFHEGKHIEKDWLLSAENVALPTSILPRFLQEIIVIHKFRQFLIKNNPKIVLCLDEKACKLAYHARPSNQIILVSWLHRSLHTFKHQEYFSLMDHHIAISAGIGSDLEKITNQKQNISVLPNCVDLVRPFVFNLFPSEKKSFLYVGRIEFEGQKYLKDLFEAFARLPKSFNLDIIGGGSETEESRCKQACVELGIADRVIFHGWQKNAWEYLNRSNINNVSALCLTSCYEGFPLVLIEAIYQGIFCISSDCPTGPSEILNNKNGFLFKTHDVDALHDCMLEAAKIKTNPLEIKDSAAKYSKEVYLNQWNLLIDKIVKNRCDNEE